MATADENVREGIGQLGFSYRETRNVLNANTAFTYQIYRQIIDMILKSGDSSPENIAARTNTTGVTFDTIGQRMDQRDLRVDDVLVDKANQAYVDTMLSNILDGSPDGVFSTYAALTAQYPKGAPGTFLVLPASTEESGHIYFWNGSSWQDAGVYQGVELRDGYLTLNKTSDSIGFNQYPFHSRATLSDNVNSASQIREAIKSITLLNADITKRYAMTDLKRNSNGVWRIDIYEVTDNALVSLVARFNATSYVEPSGIVQLELSEQNASGIHGIALVEWSKLTPGNYALSSVTGVYAARGLDIRTYTTNLDGSITSKMLDDLLSDYNYPFKDGSTLGYTRQLALQVKKAIKDVQLYGADYSKEYAIVDVKKNNSSRWRADVWEVSGATLVKQVALFHIDNYTPTKNIEKITLNEVSNSGITAEILLDWSALSNGFNSSSTVYAAERNLSSLTYNETQPEKEFFATAFPPKMYLVAGKEASIYYDGVTVCENIDDYTFIPSGGGENQSERVVFNYASPIDFTTTIKVYKGSSLRSSETVDVSVVDVNNGSGTTKRVLVLGDSTVDQNIAMQELIKNFDTDSMNVELLGTRGVAPALHEGRAGWSAADFLNLASYNGRDNAFFNPETQTFDFNYYMTQQGYSGVDHVIINLGINDSHTNSDYNKVMQDFETIISNIKSFDSTITVGVCITIPTAKERAGIYPYKREQILMARKIIDTFENRETEGVYLVPLNANLDTVRGFRYEEVPASSRSTEMIKRSTDGLHPNSYTGYPQEADTLYYYLKSRA